MQMPDVLKRRRGPLRGRGNRSRTGVANARSTCLRRAEPFDFIFIDADKPNNPNDLMRALALAHPGTLILIDNVVRGGSVIDAGNVDPAVAGTRRILEMMAEDSRLVATALQTVGHKGYDSFALARVVCRNHFSPRLNRLDRVGFPKQRLRRLQR